MYCCFTALLSLELAEVAMVVLYQTYIRRQSCKYTTHISFKRKGGKSIDLQSSHRNPYYQKQRGRLSRPGHYATILTQTMEYRERASYQFIEVNMAVEFMNSTKPTSLPLITVTTETTEPS